MLVIMKEFLHALDHTRRLALSSRLSARPSSAPRPCCRSGRSVAAARTTHRHVVAVAVYGHRAYAFRSRAVAERYGL